MSAMPPASRICINIKTFNHFKNIVIYQNKLFYKHFSNISPKFDLICSYLLKNLGHFLSTLHCLNDILIST